MQKLIIYGGAFNPPHNEHILALDNAKKILGLDKAIIVPSYYPPHKNGSDMVSFDLRFKMCSLAFPKDYISDVERVSQQKNYSINTIKSLKLQYPNTEFFYLIGGDSMADFFKWYKPEEILKEVTLVVYPRESREKDCNDAINKAKSLGGNIIKLDSVGQNISSGEIRALFSLSAKLDGIVPKEIIDFVNDKKLYSSKLVSLAKEKLSEKTFLHSVRTAIWALELNRKIGLSQQKVFESAILHDIEKNSSTLLGVPIDAISTPVAHQFSGAHTAKELGLCDDVVSAIMYHTTARENMTALEKLIYSADMTEPIRDFEGVNELREKLIFNLDEGFVACLKRSYDYLVSQNKDIYHLTEEAYNFYCKKENYGK